MSTYKAIMDASRLCHLFNLDTEEELKMLEQMEYHRLEDKLKYLIYKFLPTFDFVKTPCWAQLIEFKKFRDDLIHPRMLFYLNADAISSMNFL